MRSRLLLSLLAAAALLVGSAAQAGVLTGATWTETLQSNQIIVTSTGATCTESSPTVVLGAVVCPTAGLGATGTSTGTSYNLSLTMPLFSATQFTTGGRVPLQTVVTLVGVAAIVGSAGMATGGPNVAGIVTVKLAAHTMMSGYATVSTLVKLPLAPGKAGSAYQYFTVIGAPHYLTVDFYAWTPGTRTFTGLTDLTGKYAPTPTVVAMGSFNLTAMGGGTVTLVAPSKISIDGPFAQRRTASFTTLKLTYAVPEPATLLLLGAGVLGLALVGSRKR